MAEGFCSTCRVYFASIVLLSLKPRFVAELVALLVFVLLPKLVVNVGVEPTGPESTVLQTAEANHIAHIHH